MKHHSIQVRVPSENSPLLSSSFSAQSPRHSPWKFWRRSSPSFRWLVLFLAMLIPFGPHVVKSSLSSLAPLFFADPEFHLTHAQFGSFQSALSLPNLIVPFIGGLLLDIRGSRAGTLLFLSLAFIGHTGFALACESRSYGWAVLSRALFGLGQGSTVVAQGRIAASFFTGREVVFAIALCESFHNISALLARVYVVPIAKAYHSYAAALWIGVVMCGLSFLAGVTFYILNPHSGNEIARRARAERRLSESLLRAHEQEMDSGEASPLILSRSMPPPPHLSHISHLPHIHHVDADDKSDSVSVASSRGTISGYWQSKTLPIAFALLCLLHLVHSNSTHLFDYVAADFLGSKYGTTIEKSALMSGLSSAFAVVLCPIVGIVLDRVGYKMYAVVFCSTLTCSAYLILALTFVTPVIPLIMLSLAIATVPTILRAAVPDCVDAKWVGVGYGIYEVMESVGSVVGHVSVGYLVDKTQSYTTDILIFAGLAATSVTLAFILSFTRLNNSKHDDHDESLE